MDKVEDSSKGNVKERIIKGQRGISLRACVAKAAGWTLEKANCRAPLHEECPKHHGHKGDPGVTPGTCGAVGKRAQVFLVWAMTPGVGNASYPRRLGRTRVRP